MKPNLFNVIALAFATGMSVLATAAATAHPIDDRGQPFELAAPAAAEAGE